MIEGRRRDQWDHTAMILCYLYNANRGPKTKPLSPEAFHPLRQAKRPILQKVGIEALKIFLRGSL